MTLLTKNLVSTPSALAYVIIICTISIIFVIVFVLFLFLVSNPPPPSANLFRLSIFVSFSGPQGHNQRTAGFWNGERCRGENNDTQSCALLPCSVTFNHTPETIFTLSTLFQRNDFSNNFLPIMAELKSGKFNYSIVGATPLPILCVCVCVCVERLTYLDPDT